MINTTIESSEDSLLHLITQSEQWILPCLLLIGTTCNTLTFLVMRRGRMRHSSSCFYMATLAIADTFVLWIGCLNRWLELLDQQRPILACNLCCKFGTFAFFFFADCSVWITVAMTFERFIAVSQPLRASQLCTIRRARYTILGTFFIFFLINAHFLWTFHLSTIESHCIPSNDQSLFIKYFTWIDSFKYSFCPFTLLITLNILIIKSLIHSRKSNEFLEPTGHQTDSQNSSISSSSTPNTNQTVKVVRHQIVSNKALAYRRINRRLTTMLLTVSFAFCICSMPISIMQLIDAIYSDVDQRSATMKLTISIGKIIAEISQYVNHSSNFFLYAFTGRIFRHELRRLFTCENLKFFSLTSSQRLRQRAKKFISGQNPNQGVHEHFYCHGQRQTRILIAPKHSTDRVSRPSLTSTYSLSHLTIPKTSVDPIFSSSQHLSINVRSSNFTDATSIMFLESPSFVFKPKSSLISLVEMMKTDATTPLLHSSTLSQPIQPYGLTDPILSSTEFK